MLFEQESPSSELSWHSLPKAPIKGAKEKQAAITVARSVFLSKEKSVDDVPYAIDGS